MSLSVLSRRKKLVSLISFQLTESAWGLDGQQPRLVKEQRTCVNDINFRWGTEPFSLWVADTSTYTDDKNSKPDIDLLFLRLNATGNCIEAHWGFRQDPDSAHIPHNIWKTVIKNGSISSIENELLQPQLSVSKTWKPGSSFTGVVTYLYGCKLALKETPLQVFWYQYDPEDKSFQLTTKIPRRFIIQCWRRRLNVS